MKLRRAGSVALVLLVIVLAAAAAIGGFAVTDHIRDSQHHTAAAPTTPVPPAVKSALAMPSAPPSPSSSSTPSTPPPTGVAAALSTAVHSSALGGRVLAAVYDTSSAALIYSRHGGTAAAPASTAKVLTAVALLASYSPNNRIETKVVAGVTPGTVVLVGDGDPTLSGAAPGQPTAYPDAARLSDLASQLRSDRTPVTQILVDDSAFSGPDVSPDWAPGDVPSSYASPITAVMADGGRAMPDDMLRSATPDVDAGRELATLLGQPALPVTRGLAPPGAKELASVLSAPLSVLVDQMLQDSDNVIAECLARQVAIAKGATPSFTGAVQAVRAVVSSLGVDPGPGLHDGSGLAADDRLAPAVLAQVFALIISNDHPTLHGIVAALPVAAWSGTLASRFVTGSAAGAGAGVIRAKTGTLTGVSSLAGIVHDASGQTLVFALIADQVGPSAADTTAAEGALDAIAATLAGCGCTS